MSMEHNKLGVAKQSTNLERVAPYCVVASLSNSQASHSEALSNLIDHPSSPNEK